MATFFKIAWRNILRNKKRSLLTIGAVGLGIMALIFIRSFIQGAHWQMIENYTSLVTSHIQIHRNGFHQQQKLETNLSRVPELVPFIKRNPSVMAITPRIKAVGLVSSAESSAGVLVMGIDPETEPRVSHLHKRIKSGQFLSADNDQNILLGASLAKNLNILIGDKVVIMSQATDGSIAAGAFYVHGLFDTGTEEIDKALVLITYKAAQDLFGMPGKASEISIRLKSVEASLTVAKELKATLKDPQLEVLPWQEISPSFAQWIEFDNGFIGMIVLVMVIVVGIGILNTVLMGVLERTREFGILLAMGTKRQQIVEMVAWESVLLGTVGSALGIILGGILALYFAKAGINLSIFTQALNSFYIDSVVYPRLNFEDIVNSMLLVLATSVVVSVYPAWHASRLKPIEAIRSI